jgi:hypothetical protein
MGLNIANIGKTTHKALTGADDSVTLGPNWVGAYIIADADCHITVDGTPADQTACYVKAGERFPVYVQPPQSPNSPLTGGGGVVHFIKHTGATDGNIWITEVC